MKHVLVAAAQRLEVANSSHLDSFVQTTVSQFGGKVLSDTTTKLGSRTVTLTAKNSLPIGVMRKNGYVPSVQLIKSFANAGYKLVTKYEARPRMYVYFRNGSSVIEFLVMPVSSVSNSVKITLTLTVLGADGLPTWCAPMAKVVNKVRRLVIGLNNLDLPGSPRPTPFSDTDIPVFTKALRAAGYKYDAARECVWADSSKTARLDFVSYSSGTMCLEFAGDNALRATSGGSRY